MNDNKIIKALEYCTNPKVDEKCPKSKGGLLCSESCQNSLMWDTLDLINRQKAEIERLQKIIVGFMDEVGTWSNKYDVDTSNINKLPILAKEDYNIKNKIKSEAIKEFAEKLKAVFPSIAGAIDYYVRKENEGK